MKRTLLAIFLISIYACNLLDDVKKHEIQIDNQSVFILSRVWGFGGGHGQVVLSLDDSIDEEDLDMGDLILIRYSLTRSQLVLHTYERFVVPKDLASLVVVKYYEKIEYFKLRQDINIGKIKDVYDYRPFD